MQLQNIYKADINRNINGVIKVAQDDEASIKQELSEYVITRELRSHFATFFENYENSIHEPTDKIGVWISGFFGSGKSHFLKMLSYLLSNPVVAGKSAVDYFSDKFDDPMMFAQIESCAKVPTKTILFNIDNKAPINKDKTVIVRTFAKVFYEHLGYYGDDLKVAKFEQFLAKSGKSDAFKNSFKQINGDSWEEARTAFGLIEDDIVEALTGGIGMSETAARNWFNGTEDAEISIESLVRDIKDYIDSQGKDFRLMFMVDEIGQYIGSDSNLMLNLQTIVEEIGTRCAGRVWVMVTSQEAIDSITKISGNDFSKIQGRFNTRLSLSSSSVDEVIKRRILAKNEQGEDMLKMSYAKNEMVLRNLYTFDKNAAVLDMKGYAGEGEFVETYPFVPYQFKLMQNVLVQIRQHGNSGKHLSGGERSMLSGFQEAAQAIGDKDENALVPFWRFYDTVHTFLEGTIRRVIDRCQTAADSNDGVEQYDVSVLKLLYLIRYVNDVRANVDNITTLMIDDIRADKIEMRKQIQNSLDRLVWQNYVSRSGDTYTFLTNDEQDIERDIKKTMIGVMDLTKGMSDILFQELFDERKLRYGKNDFPFDRVVDDVPVGQPNGAIQLYFVTSANCSFNEDDDPAYRLYSGSHNAALIALPDDNRYHNELEEALKIEKYLKEKNVSQMPEAIQAIIRSKRDQAHMYKQHAKELTKKAIADADVYVAGEKLNIKTSDINEKIRRSLEALVESVYTKLSYVRKNYDDDSDILKILAGADGQTSFDGIGSPNSEACDEVLQYVDLQNHKSIPANMMDIHRRFSGIPYGWREIDIAGVVAELVAQRKLTVSYSGEAVLAADRKMPDYLRKKNAIDKTVISMRVSISPKLIKDARDVLKEYYNVNTMTIPEDEDKLIEYIVDSFTKDKQRLTDMLSNEYGQHRYPGKDTVQKGIDLYNKLLAQRKDNVALLNAIVDSQDEMFDQADDMADVDSFFKIQKEVFKKAAAQAARLENEKDYLEADSEAVKTLGRIREILESPRPYNRISELPELCKTLEDKYNAILALKKDELSSDIISARGDVHQAADEIKQQDIIKRADDELDMKQNDVRNADSITRLDAMKTRINAIRQKYIQQIMTPPDGKVDIVTTSRSAVCHSAKLRSEADIDEYLSEVKQRLMEKLGEHEILQIM